MWTQLQFHFLVYESFYNTHFCKFIFVQFIPLLLHATASTEVITFILGITAFDAVS